MHSDSMQPERVPQSDLWDGVQLKLGYASFHLLKMWEAIEYWRSTGGGVLESADTITDRPWHEPFYASFDAFLGATRSVDYIIECCFGHDKNFQMRTWFDSLEGEEKERRNRFRKRFESRSKTFREHTLSSVRHVSVHRTGTPDVVARVTGMLGVTYEGGPRNPLPTTESRAIVNLPLPLAAAVRPIPVRPRWDDFEIGSQLLRDVCNDYLSSATELQAEARRIAAEVHGDNLLTPPLVS